METKKEQITIDLMEVLIKGIRHSYFPEGPNGKEEVSYSYTVYQKRKDDLNNRYVTQADSWDYCKNHPHEASSLIKYLAEELLRKND